MRCRRSCVYGVWSSADYKSLVSTRAQGWVGSVSQHNEVCRWETMSSYLTNFLEKVLILQFAKYQTQSSRFTCTNHYVTRYGTLRLQGFSFSIFILFSGIFYCLMFLCGSSSHSKWAMLHGTKSTTKSSNTMMADHVRVQICCYRPRYLVNCRI